MARDYAKTRRRKTSKRGTKKKGNKPSFKAFASLFVVMSIFGSGLYFARQQNHDLTKPTITNVTHKQQKKQQQAKKPAKPQFEFYTLLPNPEVKSSKQAITEPADSDKPHYIVQVSSVKNPVDADRFKAQLALMGFDVEVKKISHAWIPMVVWAVKFFMNILSMFDHAIGFFLGYLGYHVLLNVYAQA